MLRSQMLFGLIKVIVLVAEDVCMEVMQGK